MVITIRTKLQQTHKSFENDIFIHTFQRYVEFTNISTYINTVPKKCSKINEHNFLKW